MPRCLSPHAQCPFHCSRASPFPRALTNRVRFESVPASTEHIANFPQIWPSSGGYMVPPLC